jgi:hypothetical protein
MRTFKVTLATALLALGMATAANALPASGAGGLLPAIQDNKLAESVHCVPGWVHWHPWGWGTGCYYRRAYPYYGFYGGPGLYAGPGLYGRRFYGRRWR